MTDQFIVSQLGTAGLVIDITGAVDKKGTPLQTWTTNFKPIIAPPTTAQLNSAANQLWAFVPGPISGSFFIQSTLDTDLVIDVTDASSTPGTPLQIWTRKPVATAKQVNDAKNQLWKMGNTELPAPPP